MRWGDHNSFLPDVPVRLCWRKKKLIAGSVNLHELPPENVQAGDAQVFMQIFADGKQPLLPMLIVLPNDIFDIVFINKEVPVEDRIRGNTIFSTRQDILLILAWDLRIRNKQGKEEGVCFVALGTAYPLDF